MQIFFGVYWAAREEDIGSATQRTVEWFDYLKTVSPHLSRWCKLGLKNVRDVDFVDTGDNQVVQKLLLRGVNHTDIPRKPIPELGWSISLWNGEAETESASASCHVGSYSRHVGNSITLSFQTVSETMFDVKCCEDVLQKMQLIWGAQDGRAEVNSQIVANLDLKAGATFKSLMSKIFKKQ